MFRFVAKGLIALGVPIILIHNLLLPDALFMFFWNIHLILVYHILKNSSKRLFLMLTITSLVMLGLRHIGIILLIPSGLYLLYYIRNSDQKVTASLSLALPILAFGVWQYFLFMEVGDFNRLNHTGELNFLTNSSQILHHITHWFVPSTGIQFLDFIVSILLIGGLIYLIRTSYQSSERTDYKIYFSIIIIAFLGFIMLKGDLLESDIERYIALIYLPTILLIIPGLQSIKDRLGTKMFLISIGIWSTYPIARLINNVILWLGF